MLTRINADGSIYREFTAIADTNFMLGDTTSSNPLPVRLDSTWKISWQYQTPEIHTNWPLTNWKSDTSRIPVSVTIWVSRKFNSVEDLAANFKFKDSHQWSNIKIKYSLEKKFRWFYTYYTYNEVYTKFKTPNRVPLEKYMTSEESEFWFNGNPELIKGMNGIEIKNYTEKLDAKFNKWIGHNIWNAEYETLINNYNIIKNCNISKARLLEEKDSIFAQNTDKMQTMNDVEFGKCIDEYFKTNCFSKLYHHTDNPLKKIDKGLGDQYFIGYFETELFYKLLMPGKILKTNNNAIMHGDTLIWKITAYRMAYKDCEISAESRKANIWAFIVTAFILLVIVAYFYKKRIAYHS
jgi:hypothetical protein